MSSHGRSAIQPHRPLTNPHSPKRIHPIPIPQSPTPPPTPAPSSYPSQPRRHPRVKVPHPLPPRVPSSSRPPLPQRPLAPRHTRLHTSSTARTTAQRGSRALASSRPLRACLGRRRSVAEGVSYGRRPRRRCCLSRLGTSAVRRMEVGFMEEGKARAASRRSRCLSARRASKIRRRLMSVDASLARRALMQMIDPRWTRHRSSCSCIDPVSNVR
jgi:hypothetical protein